MRARTGELYARFDAPDYVVASDRKGGEIRANDELLVYRRGHDLARVELTEGCRSVEVTLTPSSRKCGIDLRGAEEKDLRSHFVADDPWHLVWTLRAGKALYDHYREEVEVPGPPGVIPLRVPAGMRVDVTLERKGILVWPRRSILPESGAIQMRIELPWTPKLRIDVADRVLRRTEVEFFADMLVKPPGPATRIDAWRTAIHRPWWGRSGTLRDGGTLSLLPPVPLHAVATIGDRSVLRRFEPGDEVIDLRRLPPPRELPALPVIDGAAPPVGSWIISGRLDVATAVALVDIRGSHPGLVARVSEEAAHRVFLLAPSDWLTVWHRARGLAHLRWTAGVVPHGKWYPGSMVVRAPPGWRLDGTITGNPIWRGTGAVNTIPPDTNLKRSCDSVAAMRFRGLRPGWHAFHLHLDLVHEQSGRRHRVVYTHEVELPVARPHMEYRLHDPDRRAKRKPQ